MKSLHSRHYLAAADVLLKHSMTIIIRTRFYDFIFTSLGFSYCICAGKLSRINGHDFKLLFRVGRGGIDWKVFLDTTPIWIDEHKTPISMPQLQRSETKTFQISVGGKIPRREGGKKEFWTITKPVVDAAAAAPLSTTFQIPRENLPILNTIWPEGPQKWGWVEWLYFCSPTLLVNFIYCLKKQIGYHLNKLTPRPCVE